jgi:hypothetical protein
MWKFSIRIGNENNKNESRKEGDFGRISGEGENVVKVGEVEEVLRVGSEGGSEVGSEGGSEVGVPPQMIQRLFRRKKLREKFLGLTFPDIVNFLSDYEKEMFEERLAIRLESGSDEVEGGILAVEDLLTLREMDKEDDFEKFLIGELGCIEDSSPQIQEVENVPIKRVSSFYKK